MKAPLARAVGAVSRKTGCTVSRRWLTTNLWRRSVVYVLTQGQARKRELSTIPLSLSCQNKRLKMITSSFTSTTKHRKSTSRGTTHTSLPSHRHLKRICPPASASPITRTSLPVCSRQASAALEKKCDKDTTRRSFWTTPMRLAWQWTCLRTHAPSTTP